MIPNASTIEPRRRPAKPPNPPLSLRKPAVKGLGKLPEWNLADLYAGIDDPAVKRDLDRADADCVAFEEAYKGKLAALADGAGRRHARSPRR